MRHTRMLVLLSCAAMAACADPEGTVRPELFRSGPAAIRSNFTIHGPSQLQSGEYGQWTVTWENIPPDFETSVAWFVNGVQVGTGTSYSRTMQASFTLVAHLYMGGSLQSSDTHEVTLGGGNDDPEPGETCTPSTCFVTLFSDPAQVPKNVNCTYGFDTNYPADAPVEWRVDNVVMHTGLAGSTGATLTYAHPNDNDFEVMVSVWYDDVAVSHDEKIIEVGSAFSCNL